MTAYLRVGFCVRMTSPPQDGGACVSGFISLAIAPVVLNQKSSVYVIKTHFCVKRRYSIVLNALWLLFSGTARLQLQFESVSVILNLLLLRFGM